jgi:hypothetical protein
MKTELVRLTVTVTAQQRQLLTKWTDATRMPASYLIRQLIDDHLSGQEDQKQSTGG